jgi:hypothetical protein
MRQRRLADLRGAWRPQCPRCGAFDVTTTDVTTTVGATDGRADGDAPGDAPGDDALARHTCRVCAERWSAAGAATWPDVTVEPAPMPPNR